jgi:hypothetical protein
VKRFSAAFLVAGIACFGFAPAAMAACESERSTYLESERARESPNLTAAAVENDLRENVSIITQDTEKSVEGIRNGTFWPDAGNYMAHEIPIGPRPTDAKAAVLRYADWLKNTVEPEVRSENSHSNNPDQWLWIACIVRDLASGMPDARPAPSSPPVNSTSQPASSDQFALNAPSGGSRSNSPQAIAPRQPKPVVRRGRIVVRNSLDRDFDPDWKAYYASKNTPYLRIEIPQKPDMRLRMDREPCELDANTELADCKATGKPPARWISVEVDGKMKTATCPSGPPEQCLYLWRMMGAEVIAMAKSLDDGTGGGGAGAATAAGAVAGNVQKKQAPKPVSNCVSLDPKAVLYGGFVNDCGFDVYVSYCALHP